VSVFKFNRELCLRAPPVISQTANTI